MTNPYTKTHTTKFTSASWFVDDPIVDSYDKHGKYLQKETLVFRSKSYINIRKVIKLI